ncbi:hypothetical protein NE619_12690 [Anaerovorax odorimutans]|uniref:Collagen-like protein n=1 Tax=Anaerovorax odorimutans TaxID=109327 RepID=A0ABT1RQZ9_9FIRM|nr:hypothetical protein [Anaerovorax odorimutans]MCQ4637584.1 hypothetical protein [Anaerovorax odorimutans]
MCKERDQLLMEVMDWQEEYFINHVKERKPQKGTIYTKDYEEGFFITPEACSLGEPVYLDVPDLDTMKKLCNPDELVAMGEYGSLCGELPEWEAADSLRDFSDFSILEKSALCDAFNQYVYRDSSLVKSYKQPLNQYYFPMKVPVFEYEDIVVTKGHPLYIGKEGDEPTIVHFRNMTLEKGAQVITRGVVQVISDKVKSLGTKAEPDILASVGNNGADNTGAAAQGATGDPGTPGTSGTSGKNSCSIQPSSGGPGGTGKTGALGKSGWNGTNGGILEKKQRVMEGFFYVYSNGGNGGNAGRGGKGGTGGNGGDAAPANGHCPAGNPGTGGNGGVGGIGGNGGNGGDGKEVNIMYNQEASPTAKFKVLTPAQAVNMGLPNAAGGTEGAGGFAGEGGIGGRCYDASGKLVPSGDTYKGQPGVPGSDGDAGETGSPGDIFINGTYI